MLDPRDQIPGVPIAGTIDLLDHIAFLQSGTIGRATRHHVVYQRIPLRRPQTVADLPKHIPDRPLVVPLERFELRQIEGAGTDRALVLEFDGHLHPGYATFQHGQP